MYDEHDPSISSYTKPSRINRDTEMKKEEQTVILNLIDINGQRLTVDDDIWCADESIMKKGKICSIDTDSVTILLSNSQVLSIGFDIAPDKKNNICYSLLKQERMNANSDRRPTNSKPESLQQGFKSENRFPYKQHGNNRDRKYKR